MTIMRELIMEEDGYGEKIEGVNLTTMDRVERE